MLFPTLHTRFTTDAISLGHSIISLLYPMRTPRLPATLVLYSIASYLVLRKPVLFCTTRLQPEGSLILRFPMSYSTIMTTIATEDFEARLLFTTKIELFGDLFNSDSHTFFCIMAIKYLESLMC